MQTKIPVLFLLLLSSAFVRGQDFSLYQRKLFIQGNDTLPYRLLLPANYNASKKYPLIVFLHGSGEKGRDNEKQLLHGGDLFLRADIRSSFPAIVVFPQCPEGSRWANYQLVDSGGKRAFVLQASLPATKPMLLLAALIRQMKEDFRLQEKRLYVGGLSMGGMGTFELVRRNPKLFAAAFPICGAADSSTAKSMRKISWRIFHGAKDDVVPPASSIAMAAALKQEGADVRLTIYPEANHNSWDAAFAEKDLMPWLFSKHK